MQNHYLQEEQPEGYVSPIANLRVTAQELAQAVASIEAKRDTNADTIAIGDAINQLGLNVTPQEVYAEIRKQQSQPILNPLANTTPLAQEANTRTERSLRRRRNVWRLVMLASLGFNFLVFFSARSVRVEYAQPAMAMSAPMTGTMIASAVKIGRAHV